MSPERREQVEQLFEASLELEGAERSAWLASHCAEDVSLRRAVESLLAAHERSTGILEGPAVPTRIPESGERRIGPYRVLAELGRGGMGVVYLAERDDGQYRRRVALKLLRASPDAEDLHHRFLAERQILATLDHSNVAQLLDGGVTDGELPYLVMEFVDGLPITEYCDRNRLPLEGRLRLFMDVCAAVHHAHQNLVVHRDLKPSNIMVTAGGQVKLLDFGIAKLLNPGMSAAPAPVTRFEARLLTPEYASPEQLHGGTISTASDIYALGIVLHELLVGRAPYLLAGRTAQEAERIVCAGEPAVPSSLLTDDPQEVAANAVAYVRRTTMPSLRRQLKGELDAILLMALRVDPSARYGSVQLLAHDIQRFLQGQPVLAHFGSKTYRLRKSLRRHRVLALSLAAVLVSLQLGAGAAIWQASIASRERDRVTHALEESDAVTEFLMQLFEAGSPDAGEGQLTARDLLRRGTERVELLSDRPLLQARLLETTGGVYLALRMLPEARAQLERALSLRLPYADSDGRSIADVHLALSEVLRLQSHPEEARRHALRALAIRREIHPLDASVGEALVQLGSLEVYFSDLAASERYMREALAVHEAVLQPGDPRLVATLTKLGNVLNRRADYDGAEALFRRALSIARGAYGENDARIAVPLNRLAVHMEQMGRLSEAERVFRDARRIQIAELGEHHVRVIETEVALAAVLSREGKHEEAVRLTERALASYRNEFGPENTWVASGNSALAKVLFRAGRVEEAIASARTALAITRRVNGPDHGTVAGAMVDLAEMLASRHEYQEAEQLYRSALEIRKRPVPDSPIYGTTLAGLGHLLALAGRRAQAEQYLLEGVAIMRRQLPENHFDLRIHYSHLAHWYAAWGQPQLAAKYRALAPAGDSLSD